MNGVSAARGLRAGREGEGANARHYESGGAGRGEERGNAGSGGEQEVREHGNEFNYDGNEGRGGDCGGGRGERANAL
eukprot:3063824-Pyramimonas_sp.AAC.1